MDICSQISELTCKNCIYVSSNSKSCNCCISHQKLEWNKPVKSTSFCGDGFWVAVSSHGEVALIDRVEAVKSFVKLGLAEYFEDEGVLEESDIVNFTDESYAAPENGFPLNMIEVMIENRLVDVHAKLDSVLNLLSMIHDSSEQEVGAK